jgi:hypothetical protein
MNNLTRHSASFVLTHFNDFEDCASDDEQSNIDELDDDHVSDTFSGESSFSGDSDNELTKKNNQNSISKLIHVISEAKSALYNSCNSSE